MDVSLVAACDMTANDNYGRGWDVISGVFLSVEGISKYRSCIMCDLCCTCCHLLKKSYTAALEKGRPG